MGIAMLLESVASAFPDRPLVSARDGALSAAGLLAQASGGATVLRDAGADAVGFVGVGSAQFPAVLYAAALAGIPFTPLNYRLPAAQIAELAAGIGQRPVLVVGEEYAHAVQGTAATILTTGQWLAAARAADPAPPQEFDDERPAVVLYTSGTTSKPKGAVLRHSHLVSYVLQTVEFGSAAEDDAALISVPPYHVAGVGTVLTNTFAGRRVVYLPNFAPAGWLETVAGEGITQAMLVPTMLARIVDHLDGGVGDVPTLRAIAYGGARMPRPVLEKALTCLPDVDFTNAYGLTETSSTIAVLGPEDHRTALTSADPAVRDRLGSAGRLVPGVEGQVRDELGAVLAAGQPGQVWVRGSQVSGEYLGTGSVLDDQGWFHTRDQGWLDSDGYLFISGRTDDTIIRGGENIAPAEIEDVLVMHPAVKEVAVVGVPDEEWGTRITAVVVAAPGSEVTGDDIREYVRARLRGSRTPDDVVFRTELPHTPTGKLLRRELVRDLDGAGVSLDDEVRTVLTALPDPVPGTVRRTVSLELTPDPDWGEGLRVTATGRDVLIEGAVLSPALDTPVPGVAGLPFAIITPTNDNSKKLGAARITVMLDGRSRVTSIEGDVAPAVTGGLLGAGAISGFRARLAELAELDPSSLASAVLDELPTVRLISGYARMIESPRQMTFRPGQQSPMVGICAGWAPEATADRRARDGRPVVTGTPPAAAIASMTPYFHAEPDPRPRSMRRRRILDVTAQGDGYEVFEYFRDSHFDAGLREGALHEYVVRARVAADDGLTIQHVEVTPLALPFAECPLAAPNAAELTGMATREITRAVRERLRGTGSCTHLNDTLRFLRHVPALAAAISANGGHVSGP